MSRKFLLFASLIVILLGVVAVGIVTSGSENGTASETSAAPPGRGDTSEKSGRRFAGDPSAGDAPSKTEREIRDEALVAEYGEARTNLARHVSGNVVSLLDDALEMGEMMMDGNALGGGRWQLRQVTRNTDIELDESQRERAAELFADYQRRELDRTRETVDRLRRDPGNLMSLILAGDAHARGEMSEEEYKARQQSNADALSDVINPLERDNFRGGNPLEDGEFRRSFEDLLDADQAAALAAANPDDPDEAADDRSQTSITEMPVMDLETLDQTIGSAKQMTSGFRQMMEGMGNLGPLLEQQRQNREDQE